MFELDGDDYLDILRPLTSNFMNLMILCCLVFCYELELDLNVDIFYLCQNERRKVDEVI